MADTAGRRDDDLSYLPLPRLRRKEHGGSSLAGLAAVTLLAAAIVYGNFPTPVPTVVDDPSPAVMARLPPPEVPIASAQVPEVAAAEAQEAPAVPVTENPREAFFAHYTTDPGILSRAVVRIDGKVVLNRKLFRKKSDGGAAIRAMPKSNCTGFFLGLAGDKPIYTDAVTVALPAARRYSLEIRWYNGDGDETTRDTFDVDGKKAISRRTSFHTVSAPMIGEYRIGGLPIETAEINNLYAGSMSVYWSTPKRPSWQPELPKQASFFGP